MWSLSTGHMVHVFSLAFPSLYPDTVMEDTVQHAKEKNVKRWVQGLGLERRWKGLVMIALKDNLAHGSQLSGSRLDSDSSRLKSKHQSGMSCRFPANASFIMSSEKGRGNQRSVPPPARRWRWILQRLWPPELVNTNLWVKGLISCVIKELRKRIILQDISNIHACRHPWGWS